MRHICMIMGAEAQHTLSERPRQAIHAALTIHHGGLESKSVPEGNRRKVNIVDVLDMTILFSKNTFNKRTQSASGASFFSAPP